MPRRGENNPGKGDGDQRGPGLGCRCQAGVGAVGPAQAGMRPGWEMPLLSPPPYPATPWACRHPSPAPHMSSGRPRGPSGCRPCLCGSAQEPPAQVRVGGWASRGSSPLDSKGSEISSQVCTPTLPSLLSVQGLRRPGPCRGRASCSRDRSFLSVPCAVAHRVSEACVGDFSLLLPPFFPLPRWLLPGLRKPVSVPWDSSSRTP